MIFLLRSFPSPRSNFLTNKKRCALPGYSTLQIAADNARYWNMLDLLTHTTAPPPTPLPPPPPPPKQWKAWSINRRYNDGILLQGSDLDALLKDKNKGVEGGMNKGKKRGVRSSACLRVLIVTTF